MGQRLRYAEVDFNLFTVQNPALSSLWLKPEANADKGELKPTVAVCTQNIYHYTVAN